MPREVKGFFGELGDELFSDSVKESFKYLFQAIINEIQNLMSIMQTNKGRDKVFGLIQYLIMMYVKCMSSPNQSLSLHRVFRDEHLQKLMEHEDRLPKIEFSMTRTAQTTMTMPASNGESGPDFLNNYFKRVVIKDHEE